MIKIYTGLWKMVWLGLGGGSMAVCNVAVAGHTPLESHGRVRHRPYG